MKGSIKNSLLVNHRATEQRSGASWTAVAKYEGREGKEQQLRAMKAEDNNAHFLCNCHFYFLISQLNCQMRMKKRIHKAAMHTLALKGKGKKGDEIKLNIASECF